jgi:hypothetical protein
MENVMLVMARLGWRWRLGEASGVEAGAKIFLPFSPFSGELFRYYEEGGGVTADGNPFGGEQLRRLLSFYLQGNF